MSKKKTAGGRPFRDDPITAARGALKGRLPPTEELRANAREAEADAAFRDSPRKQP